MDSRRWTGGVGPARIIGVTVVALAAFGGCMDASSPPVAPPAGPTCATSQDDARFQWSPDSTSDRYSGPLYATSEKLGEGRPFDLILEDMDRNDVAAMIGYFFLEGEQRAGSLEADEDLGYLLTSVRAAPGRVLPFFSPGFDDEKMKARLGTHLVQDHDAAWSSSTRIAGEALLAGIGELEVMDWDLPPNDPRVKELFEFSAAHRLDVMLHIRIGDSQALAGVLDSYPTTRFILHMYPFDLDAERDRLVELIQDHDNLYYTINVDHMLHDPDAGTGLLYKYEDEPLDVARQGFIEDFEEKGQGMMVTALERFGPLIRARSDRVVWGTEMNPRYNFEPEVYDRSIAFSREFLAAFDTDAQERVAYANALHAFGLGIVCP